MASRFILTVTEQIIWTDHVRETLPFGEEDVEKPSILLTKHLCCLSLEWTLYTQTVSLING